jgi:hypothetical protein
MPPGGGAQTELGFCTELLRLLGLHTDSTWTRWGSVKFRIILAMRMASIGIRRLELLELYMRMTIGQIARVKEVWMKLKKRSE